MAKIEYGLGVANMSGKLAGQVHTRNKGGSVVRQKVKPTNPNTSFQSLVRTYMATLSKNWAQTLTDNQRKEWSAFGVTIGTTGAFGARLNLSGLAAYQMINKIILQAGGTILSDPPVSLAVQGITTLSLVANHTGPLLTLTFTPTPYSAGTGLYIFGTPAISPGIQNVSNRLRFIKYYDAATSTLELHTDWVTRFGSFPTAAGQRIALGIHAANKATGAISPMTMVSTIVI